MAMDIKLSKAQLSKIIQSGWFLGALQGKLAGAPTKVVVPLVKNVLAPLATMALAAATDEAGAVRAGKVITLVISNENIDVITIIKSLKNSEILIGRVSATVKHERKRPNSEFLGVLLETLGASMLGNMLNGKGAVRAGTGYNNMDHMHENV